MFGKHVIRLGDPTTHGGEVVSASSNTSMFDKEVACMGDHVTCPIKGHGSCVIVEGDPTWSINGRNVALEGHKTSCGASLISTLGNVTRSYEGMGTRSSVAHAEAGALSMASATTAGAVSKKDSTAGSYDQHFLLVNNQTGRPLGHVRYMIHLSDGRSCEGVTDENGKTEKVTADSALGVKIEVLL